MKGKGFDLTPYQKLMEVTRTNEKGFSWMIGHDGLTVVSHKVVDDKVTDELEVNVFGWEVLGNLTYSPLLAHFRKEAKLLICSNTGEIVE